MRHIVPGNGGMMSITCEDYEVYVAAQLTTLREQMERTEEHLSSSRSHASTSSALYAKAQAKVERQEAALQRLMDPLMPQAVIELARHALSTGEPSSNVCPRCASLVRSHRRRCPDPWHAEPSELREAPDPNTGEYHFADDPRVQPKPLYLNVPGEPSKMLAPTPEQKAAYLRQQSGPTTAYDQMDDAMEQGERCPTCGSNRRDFQAWDDCGDDWHREPSE